MKMTNTIKGLKIEDLLRDHIASTRQAARAAGSPKHPTISVQCAHGTPVELPAEIVIVVEWNS